MVRDQALLKQLMTQISKARGEFEGLKTQQAALAKEIALKQESIHQLEARVDALKSEGLVVTEHAILRYFERILGANTDELRKNILTPELVEQHAKLGDGEYPVNGFRVKIRGNAVITIMTKEPV